ncbi:MAG: hypothetical protein CMN30_24860 [Sandaracinus sp.]|nr:hypothetical protein [Sandaracinus sp.]
MRAKFICLLVSLAACAVETPGADPAGDLTFPVVTEGSVEEAAVLAFVNDAATTVTVLDDEVPLDARAATNLVARRDGADGVWGTADDAPFVSIADLDSVPWVGSAAIDALLAHARANGWLDAGADQRNAAILGLVNDATTTLAVLDDEVPLDARAATNIVAHRDGADGVFGTGDDRLFASVAELDMVPYVGPSALDALAAYALAHGFGDVTEPPAATPCALISEVVEAGGNYNKAVEITNCGDAPLELADLGFCLVRNDDTTCSDSVSVGVGTLAPGAVHVLCRSAREHLNDPFPLLAQACDQEVGTAASFNGDDRLVLFADTDRDGFLGVADPLLDVFGDMARRPTDTVWADQRFRRCDPAPHVAGPFRLDGWTITGRYEGSVYDDLGVPPVYDCAAPVPGAEGEDCTREVGCEEGLRCEGVPFDGSGDLGKCIDPVDAPGVGDTCDPAAPCADGQLCAGSTLWGNGFCVPGWMAGRFASTETVAIPETGAAEPGLVVYGLATVPMDIEVVVQLDHPRRTDLRLTLVDPNGSEAPLWDRTPELEATDRSFALEGSIARDDMVNGEWHLRVEDLVSGETGTLERWSLFIVSRYD